MTRISEGVVNNYLIPGVFITIAGIICLVIGTNGPLAALICGILLISVAILLFSATSGLEIDEQSKRYRKYGKFGPLVLGDWQPIPELIQIRIQIHTETTTRGGVGAIPIPQHTTKALTYDVSAVDKLEDEKIIYSFLKYRNAKLAGEIIAKCTDAPIHNKVAEKLARNRSRRR